MTATLAQHIAARGDLDLRQRMVAAAEQAGVDNAAAWVDTHVGDLVAAPISGGTSSLADVHAYAVSQTPPPPGMNPAFVTDALIAEAVAAVNVP